jgi:hypothetical protein
MATRIYSILSSAGELSLVEAPTKVSAIRHVAEKRYTAAIADQKTLVDAMRRGVRIEVAGEEPETAEAAAEA